MENRNYTGLLGENMMSPSIFNTAQKAPMPVLTQPITTNQPAAVPQQETRPMPAPMPPPMAKQMPAPMAKQMPAQQPIYIPQPAPMPKQMPQPKPMPMPQPIVVQQPAPQPKPMPMPQPIVIQQPAPQPKPMPMPQPIIIQQPAPQPMPQPIIIQQPSPQPMPQPTQMQQMEVNIQLVYPEVYYRLQPHIKKACDRMDLHSAPTQEMLDSLTESIHDEVCRAHPDLADYVYGQAVQENPAPRKKGCCTPCRNTCGGERNRRNPYTDRGPNRPFFPPSRPPFPPPRPPFPPPRPPFPPPRPRPPFFPFPTTGGRGILGDLIQILLLNEFLRRRR